jgi:CIC family chloride channel protein
MIKRAVFIAMFGILTGIVASLATVIFIELVEIGNRLLFVNEAGREKISHSNLLLLVAVLIPAAGGLVVGLLTRVSGSDRPLNLSDTIESAQTLKYDAPLKSGLTTALASVISIASGASVGQYGPVAHLGSTLGVLMSRFTKVTGFTPTMGIGCGAAAAIATAFNAPIAGLLFAHEVILRHYSLRAFAPIAVAAATGYVFENHVFQRSALFEIQAVGQIHAPEYLVFILMGICSAYVASLLVRAVMVSGNLANRLVIPDFTKPAVAGAFLGAVAIWIPEVLGTGESVIHNTLSGSIYGNGELIIILLAKLAMTALCLGFGFAGGIFSPALVIGIVFGAITGSLAGPVLAGQFSDIVVYAICGMVAVTSPVIGAPLTAILIVFELTHNYDLTIAAMVCVVFSNLVGYQLMGRSMFDIQLKERGIDLGLGRDKAVMNSRDISSLVSQDFISARSAESILELKNRMADDGQSEGLVLGGRGEYLGTLSLATLVKLEREGVAMDSECARYASREPLVLDQSTTIWAAMELVRDFIGESIPVVISEHDDELVGVVFEASIIQGYMDALHSIRHEEHGAS